MTRGAERDAEHAAADDGPRPRAPPATRPIAATRNATPDGGVDGHDERLERAEADQPAQPPRAPRDQRALASPAGRRRRTAARPRRRGADG